MRILIACAFVILSSSFVSAGECANGRCGLGSRVVTVTKEVVKVPVQVTGRTVEVTRNFGRRTASRVRSVVR